MNYGNSMYNKITFELFEFLRFVFEHFRKCWIDEIYFGIIGVCCIIIWLFFMRLSDSVSFSVYMKILKKHFSDL